MSSAPGRVGRLGAAILGLAGGSMLAAVAVAQSVPQRNPWALPGTTQNPWYAAPQQSPTYAPPERAAPPAEPQQGGSSPHGYPAYGASPYGSPQYGAPQYGAPQYGSPQYGTPQYGSPPGYPGGWPYSQAPGGRAATAARPTAAVRLEADRAYVHQGLVLTVEVVSSNNLKTISVDLPTTEGAILGELGKPTARAETRDGQRMIINQLNFRLIPLRPGRLEIDPLKVTGTDTDGRPFETGAPQRPMVDVLPPEPGIQPWLPLRELTLSARLVDDESVGEGKPLTLIVEQKALGMAGSQLPSPEYQLKAAGHQLYREQTEQTGLIDDKGRLVGTRIDRFTLVPLRGGALVIPEISVTWWNVDKKRREVSIIPSRHLNAQGLPAGAEGAAAPETGGLITPASRTFWIGFALAAFLAGLLGRWLLRRLWWLDARFLGGRGASALRRAGRAAAESLGVAFEPVREAATYWANKLSPRRLRHLARHYLAVALPRPLRLWFCIRIVAKETDPEDWASVFRFLLEKRLGISAQKSFRLVAADLAAIHRGSDFRRLDALLRQLEAALFGRRPLADFAAWKRDFNREIRPRPWTLFRSGDRPTAALGLPTLNPE